MEAKSYAVSEAVVKSNHEGSSPPAIPQSTILPLLTCPRRTSILFTNIAHNTVQAPHSLVMTLPFSYYFLRTAIDWLPANLTTHMFLTL